MARRKSVKTIEAILLVDLTQFNKGLAAASRSLAKTGDKIVAQGKKLSLGITTPLLGAGLASTKLAADVEISQRRFQKVFGNSAEEVQTFSKTLARATGNSAFELQALLAGTQDLVTGLGASTGEAALLSKGVAQLGADLASFVGGSVTAEQTINALTKALLGETEGLKTLGLSIKAVDIDQQLLSQGIEGGAKNATAAQKAFAVFAIAQRQSANAAGAAARNSDTLNAKIDALTSSFIDSSTELGQRFLPIAKDMIDRVQSMVDAFDDLDESQKTLIVQMAAAAAAIGPLTVALGLALKAAAALVSSVVSIPQSLKKVSISLGPAIGTFALLGVAATSAVGALLLLKAVFQELTDVDTGFFKSLGQALESFDKKLRKSTKGFSDFLEGARKFGETASPSGSTPEARFVQELSARAERGEETFSDRVLQRAEADTQSLLSLAKKQGTAFSETLKTSLGFDSILNLFDDFQRNLERKTKESAERQKQLALEAARNNAIVFGGLNGPFNASQLGQVPELSEAMRSLDVSAPNLPDGAPDSVLPLKEDIEETAGFIENLQQAFKSYTDAAQIGSDLVTSSIKRTSDAIGDAILAGGDLKTAFTDIFKAIIEQIIRAIIQMTIFRTVSSAVGGLGGGGVGGASAAFAGGFAAGGRIPSGQFGLVGERGPELISGPANVVPLSGRGIGGDVFVNVENNTPATARVEESMQDGNRQIRVIVENVIAQDVRRNGPITRTITNTTTARRRAS